jgi:hypothetical protein
LHPLEEPNGVSAVRETHDRWKGDPAAPTWLRELATDQPLDFAQAAMFIKQSGPDADWFLAERLELAGRDGARYVTPGSIIDWLYLAKGIRNREVHAESWPIELRCVATFIARLLLYAFVSTFPEVAPTQSSDPQHHVEAGEANPDVMAIPLM